MKERISTVQSDDQLVHTPCTACDEHLVENDQAVTCPKCRSVHHLQCWIDRGGCARLGCKQLVDQRLRPPKKPEKPIEEKKTPRHIIAIVVVLIIAGGIGLYRNAERARLSRQEEIAVMVSSLEPQTLWEDVVFSLNATEDVDKRAELYYVPYGPGGTSFEQKYIVMSAAREAPELIVLEYHRFDLYADQHLLLELNDILPIFEENGITLDPDALDRFTVDGDLLGLPHPDADKPLVLAISRLSVNPDDGKEALYYVYEALIASESTTDESAPEQTTPDQTLGQNPEEDA